MGNEASMDSEKEDETLPEGDESNEIITLDDSDISIYEVPVPPKPKPLIINLDVSDSLIFSDSDSSIEILTPKESAGSRNHQPGSRAESTARNNTIRNAMIENYFPDSNTDDDENEIDSDLEDKLYAAVFHSNDITSKGQDQPLDYSNFTSLNDVVNSWKNINDQESEKDFANADKNLSVPKDKTDCDTLGAKESCEIGYERLDYDQGNVSWHGNRVEESRGLNRDQKCPDNTETSYVLVDEEAGTDICREKEKNNFGKDINQGKGTIQNHRQDVNSGNKSPGKYIMKKQNHSPRKSAKSKDPKADHHYSSPRKSHRGNDNEEDVDTRAGNDSRKNSVTESSNVKAKNELQRNEIIEEERRILSPGHQACRIEEDIKPEEESAETCQSTDRNKVAAEASNEPEVKPEEAQNGEKDKETVEKDSVAVNEASMSSSESSSSDSTSVDSSSSSSERETQNIKRVEGKDRRLPERDEYDEIITLDDSEGSIYEVPVPPKPRPPTINLDDSESSTSCDSDAETEILTPKELLESYKSAVSESDSRSLRRSRQHTRTQSRRASSSSSSNSKDSMTESEEENWGIIAGRQINTDQSASSSSNRDLRTSDITDKSTTDLEQQASSCQVLEDGDRSANLVSKERENQIRESQSQPYSKTVKKTGSDLLTKDSSAVEKQSGETRRKSGEKIAVENQSDGGGDALIINAESDGSLIEKDRGEETPRRISENRKRPINNDSGKKSKQRNSPKKAKSSDDSNAAAGSSTSKTHRENKENKDKQRNRAADYFFTPMNNEMENYYNKSWGGENFDIDEIRNQMPRDQRHWAVLNEDLLSYQQRRSRYWSETKCRNCRHTGHHLADCPEKRKVPSCHMCGRPGHREPRCPHKMCLGCGKKQKTYMQVCSGCRRAWCDGCQSYGHLENNCPDLWRRYHVTTSHGDVNTHLSVEDVMKPQHLLSCCNCAKRGHDSTTCDNYRWSRHFPTPAYVTNYTTGPAYPEDRIREDVEVAQEARELDERETRPADGDSAHRSSSSSEGRKRRSNGDEVASENPARDEVSQTGSKEKFVGKNIDEAIKDKGREQPKEKHKSNEERVQRSRELLPTKPKIRESGEILLTLTSHLLNAEFTQAANFAECVFPLLVSQYQGLTDSDLSREFLLNLTSQFPMKIEMKRSPNGELAMTIASTKDLHQPIHLTIMDWLKWPLDERSRFVHLNLPTKKDELMRLLASKLEELKQYLGNPHYLHEKIIELKKELTSLQNQSIAGKTSSTSSQRARVVEELARSQCRLNMMLFGQAKLRKTEKSSKFLESVLRDMQKAGSQSYICASVYLLIVHHYNIIFSAYTPDYLSNLLDLYRQQYSARDAGNGNCNSAHVNLVKSFPKQKKKRPKKKPKDSIQIEIVSQNLVKNRGGGDGPSNKSPNCNGVESQFVVPGAGFNDANINLKPNLPLPKFPLIYDLDRLENNSYNSQYDFGDNSRYQRHRGGLQKNRQLDDYIPLYNRNLMQNNHYNLEKDLNNAGGNFGRRLRSCYVDKTLPRNNLNQAMENGIQSLSGGNVPSDSLPGRNNRGQEICWTGKHMFFSDTRTESPQNSLHNNALDASTRNEVDRRDRYNVNDGPSTSGINNQMTLHPDNRNPGPPPVAEQPGLALSKTQRRKQRRKNRETGPFQLLERRAEKIIAKYIDCGRPRLTARAKVLRKKLTKQDITVKDVHILEGMARRELKKKD